MRIAEADILLTFTTDLAEAVRKQYTILDIQGYCVKSAIPFLNKMMTLTLNCSGNQGGLTLVTKLTLWLKNKKEEVKKRIGKDRTLA